MKLIILTQYYPPEHGAPQNRLHDLAVRLKKAGFDITVLTAMPNYPKGEIFPEYRGEFLFEEEIENIKVIRSFIFPSKKKSSIRQLICYFSFVFSSIIVGLFKLRKADFLICESPPLFLGFTALILSFFKKAKLIMNISDLWPESAVQLGMLNPGLVLSVLESFEKMFYKKSALVLCQTKGIICGVKKRNPLSKTYLLPNGVDTDAFSKKPKSAKFAEEFGFPDNSLIVAYAGNHGRSQALNQVIDAAKILRGEKIFFALFGDGAEKSGLEERVADEKLENIKFYPSQPRQQMAFVLSQFDLAVVPLKNIEIFNGARPSKMFELMACEVPFIFCGRGEGADLAEKSGCAFVVPPESPEKLAETIKKFSELNRENRDNMGKTGRKFVSEHFDRAKIAESFIKKFVSGE